MGFMSLDVAFAGEYEALAENGGATSDYEHYTITLPLGFVGLPFDYSYQTFKMNWLVLHMNCHMVRL